MTAPTTAATAPRTADEIIALLRTSADEYKVAAAREGEVWGKEFSNTANNEARVVDQAASAELGLATSRLALPKVLAERGMKFERGLSLACGSGRAERQLVKAGTAASFLGIDLAEGALAEAEAEAKKYNLPITYERGDLNTLTLPRNAFDLVVTQNCLHHVLELEHLASEIWHALKPGGYLWIDDFIGETQFQWSDARLAIVNALIEGLPAELRRNRLQNRLVAPYQRRAAGTLVSPFEAIRSAEIVPIFRRWFDVETAKETNAVLHLVMPVGTRSNYIEQEGGRTVFSVLKAIDESLITTGLLPPLAGQYLLRRRETPTQ